MIIQDIREGRDETFQEGMPMSSVVQQVLNQFLSIADDIVDSIIDLESRTLNGCEPYWNKSSQYVERENGAEHYLEKWQAALDELKHSRRFFSPAATTLFDELFNGVDNLHGWNGKVFKPVVRRFPSGTTIFRARICKSSLMLDDIANDPYRHVGPPPGEHALAGRMNPEGVPVLYSSREIETCLAEMRPALGNDIAVITLKTTDPIRVLDFSRLERARSGGAISFFQPDFREQLSKQDFLKHIHKLISQHVVPGRESEYIITQTMAEYLAHVHPKPFDGILFKSTQHEKGENLVLFAKDCWYSPEKQFSVSYVFGSLKVFTTRTIKYGHTISDSFAGSNMKCNA
jgi:hypothetical protein